jgi:hypothetical protein
MRALCEIMIETELQSATAQELRLSHASYFHKCYLTHCGPPKDSYFLMIGYFDAFLFSLSSLFDLADKRTRKKLDKSSLLRFMKVLRNISTHRSVLAAPGDKGEYIRPMMRVVGTTMGTSELSDTSQLYFNYYQLREIIEKYAAVRTKEVKNIEACYQIINDLESRKEQPELGELMKEALDAATNCSIT